MKKRKRNKVQDAEMLKCGRVSASLEELRQVEANHFSLSHMEDVVANVMYLSCI